MTPNTTQVRIDRLVYGTDVDGLPAPSDFELEAADARGPWLTFDEFCERKDIQERDLFQAFVHQAWTGALPLVEWLCLWVAFTLWGRAAIIAAQDARDLANTRRDALR